MAASKTWYTHKLPVTELWVCRRENPVLLPPVYALRSSDATVCMVCIGVAQGGSPVPHIALANTTGADCPMRKRFRGTAVALVAPRVLLHAYMGSGNTWLRLLLENATGEVTRVVAVASHMWAVCSGLLPAVSLRQGCVEAG